MIIDKIKKMFKKYWIIFFILFVSVIILDFSNVISSKMHISIDSWVVALTTSATILFSFWLITDQKKIEKKRMLVAECLHNDFFSLI